MKASEVADGRWPDILEYLGLDARYLSRKNGPCPVCEGNDRYRWINDSGGGRWVCNQCRPETADGFELAMAALGMSFHEVARAIEEMRGVANVPRKKASVDYSIVARNLDRVSAKCWLIKKGGPVDRYLESRGIVFRSRMIREAVLPYYHDGQIIGEFPAMVSRVQDAAGNRQTYHIVYLSPDGAKAQVPSPKKVMSHMGGLMGAGVVIRAGSDHVNVCEGVETGLAIAQYESGGVIAALSAEGMKKIIINADQVTVYGENDASYTGQMAAYTLANRLGREGKKCRVIIPKNGDYLDSLIFAFDLCRRCERSEWDGDGLRCKLSRPKISGDECGDYERYPGAE